MDSEAIVSEVTLQSSSSSGSSSSSSLSSASSSSNDFHVDTSMNNRALEVNKFNTGGGGADDGGSGGGSDNEGFASGEEEFESAPDRPIVGYPEEEALEKAIEGEEIDVPFVDSSDFPVSAYVRPVAKVSVEGDDDEYDGEDVIEGESEEMKQSVGDNIIGGSESKENSGTGGGVSKEDEVPVQKSAADDTNSHETVNENGVSDAQENIGEISVGQENVTENLKLDEVGSFVDEKQVVEDEKDEEELKDEGSESKKNVQVVKDSAIQDDGANVLVIEPNESLVSNDGSTLGIERASVVDASHTDSLEGADVVSNVEQVKDSEMVKEEAAVDCPKLDNGIDLVSNDTEEPVADSQSDIDAEPLIGERVETAEEEGIHGENGGLVGDENIVQTVVEDDQIDNKLDASVVVGETEDLVEEDNAGTENDLEAEKEAGQKELVGETLTSVVDAESSLGNEPSTDDDISKNSSAIESEVSDKIHTPEKVMETSSVYEENKTDEGSEGDGSITDGDTEGLVFDSSEAAKQFLEELERGNGAGSFSGAESSQDHSQRIDGQIVTDSEEEDAETDEEGDGRELFDSAALAALLKAAKDAGSDGGPITITSQDGSRLFSVERPAGLGSSLPSVRQSSQPNRRNPFTSSVLTRGNDSDDNLTEEEKKKLETLQQIRIRFMRLVKKLGASIEDSLAAQVLYRIGIVAGRSSSQLFSIDAAKSAADQLEAEGRDDLNFSLNILVLGKTGVGKSATINSIFGEEKSRIDAFGPATTTIREVVGRVDGVNIRVFDTPGLKTSAAEQNVNRKILSSIQKVTKKCPPDIVLYVDRLDSQTRDLNDLPLLRSISSTLGSSIWRNAIVTLTHAASAPPDGPSGFPMNYEGFVAQRSHALQQAIGQATGDLRILNPSSMNPVSLVENHPSCRKNRDGQKVLPNGQAWRPQLLLLCYSVKILTEVSNTSKPQDSFDHRKLFGFRARSPPLPYLLSGLLQSRTHPKLSSDQGGDNGDSDIDMADLSDSDEEEEEDEYDQLPPFKPLRKVQLAKLSKEQRKAYYEEYDYRVKLLQKKQWREEMKRMKEMKKKGKAAADDYGFMGEDDQENGSPAAVQVPLPDMALPPSFDGDNPAYRYRFLEPTSQFLARPVLDTHGWDHDCGYDGVNLEQSLAIASRFPAAVAVQITKDKKEFNIHLDSSVAAKHGENGSSMAGFDIQNIGRQLAYIVRGETKFKNFRKNKTAAGISVTFLGETVCTGFKLEDQVALGKRIVLVGSTGTVRSQSDSAFGANLEVRLREADYPVGQDQSSLGLSLVKWRGDMALGANFQSQISVGRNYKMAIRAGLNNKLSGQITVRTSSSDQLQIALLAVLPVVKTIYKTIWPGVSGNQSIY